MKKIKIISVFAAALLFVSCGQNNEEENREPADVKVTEAVQTEAVTGNSNSVNNKDGSEEKDTNTKVTEVSSQTSVPETEKEKTVTEAPVISGRPSSDLKDTKIDRSIIEVLSSDYEDTDHQDDDELTDLQNKILRSSDRFIEALQSGDTEELDMSRNYTFRAASSMNMTLDLDGDKSESSEEYDITITSDNSSAKRKTAISMKGRYMNSDEDTDCNAEFIMIIEEDGDGFTAYLPQLKLAAVLSDYYYEEMTAELYDSAFYNIGESFETDLFLIAHPELEGEIKTEKKGDVNIYSLFEDQIEDGEITNINETAIDDSGNLIYSRGSLDASAEGFKENAVYSCEVYELSHDVMSEMLEIKDLDSYKFLRDGDELEAAMSEAWGEEYYDVLDKLMGW